MPQAERCARAGAARRAARISASRSGTLFAFHKMPLRNYLAAIAIFCNEVKGKSALALSRDLDVPIQDGVRPGAQAARGDGVRD